MSFLSSLDFSDTKTVGLIFGVAAIIVYVIVRKNKSALGEAIGMFLGGNSIIGGFHLCLLSLNKLACGNIDIEQSRVYVFLGGAAVIWISVSSMKSKLMPTA